jgi:hypothetical protein
MNADWIDFFDNEEDDIEKVEDFRFRKDSFVFIINDERTLIYVLKFLLDHINSPSKFCIYYGNDEIHSLSLLNAVTIQDLVTKYSNSKPPAEYYFRDVLYRASVSLQKEGRNKKKILVMLKENPIASQFELSALMVKSSDLVNSEIQLEVFGLSPEFDFKGFRKLSYYVYEDEIVDFRSFDVEQGYESLGDALLIKHNGGSHALDLPFYLTDDILIGIKG